jgi:hypothetical protein
MLGRLKSRVSTSRGPLARVYNIVVIVTDLSYTCCHNPSVIFLVLHFRIKKGQYVDTSIDFYVNFVLYKSSEIDKLKKQDVVRHQI